MTESAGRQLNLPEPNDHSPPTALKSSTHSIEALKDILFGSTAGIIGKTIEYPFDTLKVRLQSQSPTLPLLYTGPLDCLRQSLQQSGLRGLYRGISAPLLGAAIETSSLFFSYRIAQKVIQATLLPPLDNTPLPLSALIACGGASGAFTSLLLTPIELVKCQMQVPRLGNRGPSPLSIIASVYRHHGLWGFWHGQLGTLIRETGGSAAWFGSYEGVSALLRTYATSTSIANPTTINTTTSSSSSSSSSPSPAPPVPLPIHHQMLAGAFAGIAYNFIFYPADTIKSRMQTEELSSEFSEGASKPPRKPRMRFWGTGMVLWRSQGLRGLYRGCGITVARAAPSSAFIFAVYEGLRGWWGEIDVGWRLGRKDMMGTANGEVK